MKSRSSLFRQCSAAPALHELDVGCATLSRSAGLFVGVSSRSGTGLDWKPIQNSALMPFYRHLIKCVDRLGSFGHVNLSFHARTDLHALGSFILAVHKLNAVLMCAQVSFEVRSLLPR